MWQRDLFYLYIQMFTFFGVFHSLFYLLLCSRKDFDSSVFSYWNPVVFFFFFSNRHRFCFPFNTNWNFDVTWSLFISTHLLSYSFLFMHLWVIHYDKNKLRKIKQNIWLTSVICRIHWISRSSLLEFKKKRMARRKIGSVLEAGRFIYYRRLSYQTKKFQDFQTAFQQYG